MGQQTIDLFASRICHQLSQYIATKPDLGSMATDAFLILWDKEYSFAFLPLIFINQVLRNILDKNKDHQIIVKPTW